jgi:hypothetical protein
MLKHNEYEGLRGSGHRSVIPYVHGRENCIALCVALFKVELNLYVLVVCPTFYSSKPCSYTVAQGLTGDLRVVESLYSRALLARSSK